MGLEIEVPAQSESFFDVQEADAAIKADHKAKVMVLDLLVYHTAQAALTKTYLDAHWGKTRFGRPHSSLVVIKLTLIKARRHVACRGHKLPVVVNECVLLQA